MLTTNSSSLWDKPLHGTVPSSQLTEGSCKKALTINTKPKPKQQRKTRCPFVPSQPTFSFLFLFPSRLWFLNFLKSFKYIYFYTLCILYAENHASPPFKLLKSGIFMDHLMQELQFCFPLKSFIKTAHFKTASLFWFLLTALEKWASHHLVPSQTPEVLMPQIVQVSPQAPSDIKDQNWAHQGHWFGLAKSWTALVGVFFSPLRGREAPKSATSDSWVGCYCREMVFGWKGALTGRLVLLIITTTSTSLAQRWQYWYLASLTALLAPCTWAGQPAVSAILPFLLAWPVAARRKVCMYTRAGDAPPEPALTALHPLSVSTTRFVFHPLANTTIHQACLSFPCRKTSTL